MEICTQISMCVRGNVRCPMSLWKWNVFTFNFYLGCARGACIFCAISVFSVSCRLAFQRCKMKIRSNNKFQWPFWRFFFSLSSLSFHSFLVLLSALLFFQTKKKYALAVVPSSHRHIHTTLCVLYRTVPCFVVVVRLILAFILWFVIVCVHWMRIWMPLSSRFNRRI